MKIEVIDIDWGDLEDDDEIAQVNDSSTEIEAIIYNNYNSGIMPRVGDVIRCTHYFFRIYEITFSDNKIMYDLKLI